MNKLVSCRSSADQKPIIQSSEAGVNFTNLMAKSANTLGPVGTNQFHQQKYTHLYLYTGLENTINFYAVCSTLCSDRRKSTGAKAASRMLVKLTLEMAHITLRFLLFTQ
jgi:hypothetical protein